jgi:hypothetical protein
MSEPRTPAQWADWVLQSFVNQRPPSHWLLSEIPLKAFALEAINQNLAAEREACAKLVEEQGRLLCMMFETDRYKPLIADLAKAIRARSQ